MPLKHHFNAIIMPFYGVIIITPNSRHPSLRSVMLVTSPANDMMVGDAMRMVRPRDAYELLYRQLTAKRVMGM